MKIILVNPTWKETYGEFEKSAKTMVNYPPIGLCYLSAVLKRAGHRVEIIDCDVEGLTEDESAEKVISSCPDLVGFTAATTVFHRAVSLAEKVKKRAGVVTVIGGPHVTLLRDKAMEAAGCFDYGVIGEGEETIVELAAALESGQGVQGITGLVYRDGERPVVNAPRAYIEELDSLPFPDIESLKIERYTIHLPERGIVPVIPVVTSRGCPFACIYCSAEEILGRKVRYRSMENVLAEFDHITERFDFPHLVFIDETLTLNKKRMTRLCDEILEKRLNITMEGWTRPEAVDAEMLQVMKKAGFLSLSFGIESGDPKIARIIGRTVKNEVMTRAFDMAKGAGLETKGYLMIGHPFETRETIQNSFDFVCGLKNCDQIFINITTPFPGTKLYEMAKKGEGGMKLLTEDYSQYRKYGNAVITVNDLTRDDLVRLQKIGFLKFYMNPRRFLYNLKRAGIRSAFISGTAFVKSILGVGRPPRGAGKHD